MYQISPRAGLVLAGLIVAASASTASAATAPAAVDEKTDKVVFLQVQDERYSGTSSEDTEHKHADGTTHVHEDGSGHGSDALVVVDARHHSYKNYHCDQAYARVAGQAYEVDTCR